MTEQSRGMLRSAFLATAYFVAMVILGATWWKAAVIGAMTLGALSLDMGTWWISRAGAVLVVVALGMWVDLLPAPSQIKAYAATQFEAAYAWRCVNQASAGAQGLR